jgi:hypothetical protein
MGLKEACRSIEQDVEMALKMKAKHERLSAASAAAVAHERAIHDALVESKGVTSWH